MTRPRLLVTGSRNWDDLPLLHQHLNAAAQHLTITTGEVVLVHGAAKGVDRHAAHWWARQHYGPVEAHPADWQQYGKAAGPIRNAHMISLGADLCLAFIKDNSPGATHCATHAHRAAITTRIIRDPEPPPTLPGLLLSRPPTPPASPLPSPGTPGDGLR